MKKRLPILTLVLMLPIVPTVHAQVDFVKTWGSEGKESGGFESLTGIAVDSSGNVYVLEQSGNRVQKFTSDGTFITKWGSRGSDDGKFSVPIGITVDSSGNVYVAEFDNNRVQKFTSDGTFITKWGSVGSGDGQFSGAMYIAVDSSDYVYVTERDNHRVQKFDSNGNFVIKWGSKGTDNGQFIDPQGIAVDKSGNVYVADRNNARIQKFMQESLPSPSPPPTPSPTPAPAPTPSPAPAPVTIGIEILGKIGYREDPDFVSVVEVRNNGTKPLSADMTVTYYDSNNKVVAQETASSELEVIHPGQKAPFKARVNMLPPAFNYFEASVTDLRPADQKPPMLKIISEDSFIGEKDKIALGGLNVTGEVQNTGSDTARSTKVVATFYDERGFIMDTSHTFTDPQDVQPDGKAPFRIFQYNLLDSIKSYSLTVESQEYTDFQYTTPEVEPPGFFSLSSSIDGTTYTVMGTAENVKPLAFTIKPNESVQFDLSGGKGEDMELTLPKAMIDGIQTVRSGDQQIPFQQVSSNSTSTTIKFTVPDNIDSIEIIGATVVPEFPLGMTALMGAIVALITVIRLRKITLLEL